MRRRGAEEAGAIFVKINRLDGTADLYGPAPQASFDESHPSDRRFAACLATQPAPDAEIESYLVRQVRYDPDLWVIEVDDRRGRHFLDQAAP